MRAVGVIVGVLGHDTQNGERVEKHVEGLGELDLNRGVVECSSVFDHGQIGLGARRGANRVDGKRHVSRGQGLAVREHHVVAECERPGKPVFRTEPLRGKVARDLHVGVGCDQRGLNQGLVHVLAAPPRVDGTEALSRLALVCHGDNDLRRCMRRLITRRPLTSRLRRDAPAQPPSGKTCTNKGRRSTTRNQTALCRARSVLVVLNRERTRFYREFLGLRGPVRHIQLHCSLFVVLLL